MDHTVLGRSALCGGVIALCFLAFLPTQSTVAFAAFPQIRSFQPTQRHADAPKPHYREIFSEVERGLGSGNMNGISGVFAPEVQVNLRGGENGYFSSHQAYYLLDTYLRSRRLINLSFTTIGDSELNPYATGGADLLYRGSREYVQVYVALSLSGDRWVISRINIY